MRQFANRFFSDIIGFVFFLSSILKLMDPTGTGLIVDGYLSNWNLDFLRPASKLLGECLSVTEAVISIALFSGVFRKFFAWLTTAFLLFFTGISVWLVLADPQMSCGCFGEAVPLTHGQTLIKNIALLLCCVPAFMPYRYFEKPKNHRIVAFCAGIAAMLCFAVYSLLNVPLVDFTEFAPSHTIVSDNSGYESDWEYPVLPVWDEWGDDVSDAVLDGDVVVLSFYDASSLKQARITDAASFAQDALNAGYNVYALSTEMIDIPGVDCYISDYKKIITLNRTNGGATLLHDGYIIGKTSAISYLSFEDMEELTSKDAAEAYVKAATQRSLILQGFMLLFLAILIIV